MSVRITRFQVAAVVLTLVAYLVLRVYYGLRAIWLRMKQILTQPIRITRGTHTSLVATTITCIGFFVMYLGGAPAQSRGAMIRLAKVPDPLRDGTMRVPAIICADQPRWHDFVYGYAEARGWGSDDVEFYKANCPQGKKTS
jgi:hypothetical protein